MIFNSKKAVVIGETKICIQCTEYLLNNRWEIIALISDDEIVIDWAKNNSVPILPSLQLNTIKADNYYLVSIVNPYIIPKSVLIDKNLLLALNCHDAPLPKYAGAHSTTWAIINNEKEHGVTFHKIEPGIDDGAIVAQSIIPIENNETAISLDVKCSERTLSLFKEVITKIEAGALEFLQQDLTQRTYYRFKDLPSNYGIINGIKDIKALDRLVRGLTFGDSHNNPVASVKIYLDDKFYIVDSLVISAWKPKSSLQDAKHEGQLCNSNITPGLVDSSDHCRNNSVVLFNEVKDIYGNKTNLKIKYQDLLTEYALTKDDIEYLSSVKALEKKHKKQIQKFFNDNSEASTKTFNHILYKINDPNYAKEIEIPNNIPTDSALALVCFILIRLFRDDFIISLYLADKNIPSNLRNLVENRNFIGANKDVLNNSFTVLENNLIQLQKNYYTLIKDFSYRYQLPLLTDIAVVIGEVASTDQHKMIIKINDGKVKIEGNNSLQIQINNIVEALETMLAENIRDKDLKHVNILNPKQYHQIVYEWNQTEKDYPQDKTVHQLFEEQVEKTPNNVAVIYEDRKLTYNELNQKANQLAYYLLDKYAIKPDDLVVLCLDRSEYMLIAMLAALKAGGAYVPIEPNYPNERIGYVLKDTNAKAILTNAAHKKKLRQALGQQSKTVSIVAIESKKIQNVRKKNNLITETKSNNLIYVLYTSGTTGNPKGVMVEHRGVVSLVKNVDYIQVDANDSFIQSSNSVFDAATFEIWTPLLNGAKLIVPNGQIDLFGDIKLFYNTLAKNKITVLWLTKTLFDQLFLTDEFVFRDIKYLLIGGEALNRQLIEKLINSNYRPKNVINGYGPTENTSFSTTLNVTKENLVNLNTVPIGIPLSNRKAYVLDNNLNILPIIAIGELYVTGAGIARGYLNQPTLTAEKFIYNSFQTPEEKAQNKNNRLYKTGDLVRMLPDGNLEYIGRNDFQVKIRGFRIELGEIESKLLNYPEIKQAVVLVKEKVSNVTTDKYLVAYYVADKKLNEIEIYNYLENHVPEYMLPNILIYLNELPLTINGKLDKTALPEPKFEIDARYVAPRNEQEQLICQAFAKVLGIEKIGINDDFFKIGGNSLKAISLAVLLQTNFDCKVTEIFNLRTPLKLAEQAGNNKKDVIKEKLEQIKLSYKNRSNEKLAVDAQARDKITSYQNSINDLPKDYLSQKPITNVLLTGATGYLGCNLLHQLLKLTDYKIFLLIRADSQEKAFDRINRKFKFYFDKTLEEVYKSRVFIFTADIEKNNLGLLLQEYQSLIEQVDSVIHAAALVKHYGNYDDFYAANVQATINLLEFTKLTKLKDFHYISTRSVLDSGFITNCNERIYTEDDMPDDLHQHNNFYVQTKLQGEQQTIAYRRYGINSNIYRVGNLAFIAENYRAQKNIEDNAFFSKLKCVLKLQTIPENVNTVEISQVDFTASAVVKLFDKKLNHNIYHLYNPYLFSLSKFFAENKGVVKIVTMDHFIDNIINNLNNNAHYDLIIKFLLHQGWLDGWDIKNTTNIKLLQDKTIHILKNLGFEWQPISSATFNKYLEACK